MVHLIIVILTESSDEDLISIIYRFTPPNSIRSSDLNTKVIIVATSTPNWILGSGMMPQVTSWFWSIRLLLLSYSFYV